MPVTPLLRYAVVEPPQGRILLLATRRGLARVILGPPEEAIQELERFSMAVPYIVGRKKGRLLGDLRHAMKRYFSGRKVDFSGFPLDLGGATEFQRRVWDLTWAIPYGSVRSYGWVSRKMGDGGCARAVGQALSRNPVPVVFPCHRVIEESGRRGGFTAGLVWKGALLELEGGEQRLRWRERGGKPKLVG